VMKGQHRVLGKTFAIKLLFDPNDPSLENEIVVSAAPRNHNIIKGYSYGQGVYVSDGLPRQVGFHVLEFA
jgi:hypothetical protein